jgi:hypothetical protein
MHEIELRFGLKRDFEGMTKGYFAGRRKITWMEDDKVSTQTFFNLIGQRGH